MPITVFKSIFGFAKAVLSSRSQRHSYLKFHYVITTGQSSASLKLAGCVAKIRFTQELIKRSLYLPYLASESTLSRVDLFIEHLPWEIQHAHCCKSQSPLGHSARPQL